QGPEQLRRAGRTEANSASRSEADTTASYQSRQRRVRDPMPQPLVDGRCAPQRAALRCTSGLRSDLGAAKIPVFKRDRRIKSVTRSIANTRCYEATHP